MKLIPEKPATEHRASGEKLQSTVNEGGWDTPPEAPSGVAKKSAVAPVFQQFWENSPGGSGEKVKRK